MISLTEKAAEKVRVIREEEKAGDHALRVKVVGGGCSGFQYDLFFDKETAAEDVVFESHGVKIYVDPMSMNYLDGTEIDFVEGMYGTGFKFNNPNVKGTCGCGSSFSA
jgi:iron-sulfur cluster insertion protein